MQTGIIDLGKDMPPPDFLPKGVLTFRPFINYIRQLKEKSGRYKQEFLTSVLETFEQHPELSGAVDVAGLKDHEDLLNLIYTTLLPAVEDEQDHYRALALPLSPVIFYSSNDFYELITTQHVGNKLNNKFKNDQEMKRSGVEFCYLLILEKCYNFNSPLAKEMTYVMEDIHTGLTKAYRITFDTRFLEIHHDNLPELDMAKLDAMGNDKEALADYLLGKIPLHDFSFEGFRMLSVEEITGQYAIDEVKNQLLSHRQSDDIFSPQIEESLKMLLGTNDIELGLLPIFQINNKFISNDPGCTAGRDSSALTDEMAEKLDSFLSEVYLKKPKRIFFKSITPEDAERHFYLKILLQNGIRSYALVPVFFNDTLTGILEVYSHREDFLNQQMLYRLEPVMPFLSQLLQKHIDSFNLRIEGIIKENFTSIQPSVQWKFNEAAWHYVRDQGASDRPVEIENIDFEKVHPLYGSIDIRNSTIERNEAMLKDLKAQFALLLQVLEEIRQKSGFSLVDAKIFSARQWHTIIEHPDGFYQQTELNDLLENDLHPFLEYFSKGNPEFAPAIRSYFDALDSREGAATRHMRELETSMNTVIAAINNEVEEMSRQAQQAFPCFFEKFRTDGVEYDIYLGQSITPNKAFSDIYIKNLRLLQLRSMAITARATHALLPALSMPVETTQLIFIHSHPIDIKFRKDERRFDVEGAYNIRYQVVKKRIDKVHIKDTNERLTAPNKIALTYFNQKEADEYIGYIRYLQQEQLLTEEVEFLELEPLQGVVGMKALRVGVKTD